MSEEGLGCGEHSPSPHFPFVASVTCPSLPFSLLTGGVVLKSKLAHHFPGDVMASVMHPSAGGLLHWWSCHYTNVHGDTLYLEDRIGPLMAFLDKT